MPLPPVGYQLVRDPITGHLLLIPASNIEHLQRAVLWPSYPATLQPSLHMATQPATQHIQLFESTEPNEFLNTFSAAHNHNGPNQGQTTRILVQPQITLTAAESPIAKRKGTVIKVEAADCSALEVKTPNLNRPPEVSVTANTATQVFPGNTSVTHFYYEHPTAVVQLAQTPQPTAAVQTDNGKRSQATSPVNPAETSLTPPPETAVPQLDIEEGASSISMTTSCGSGDVGPVQVQDASNQTDTPPVSEDETGDLHSTTLTAHQVCKPSSTLELVSHSQPSTLLPTTPVVTTVTTTATISTTNCVTASTNTADEQVMPPIPESAHDQKPPSAETVSPVSMKPSAQIQVVDVSGLELLSNSIEQFESNHILSRGSTPSVSTSEAPTENVNCQAVNGLLILSNAPVKSTTSEEQVKPKLEVDPRPADEKAAETLQMMCQQGNQIKSEPVQCKEEIEDENSVKGSNSNQLPSIVSDVPQNNEFSSNTRQFSPEIKTSIPSPTICNNTNNNLLGGLRLLCALAEQRIMEEGAGNNSSTTEVSNEETVKDSESGPKTEETVVNTHVGTSIDVNRNYKTRKSERECKKFIANKVMQYFNQNGNRSGSSSPQHSTVHSVCASPSSAEIMDAMELDMRMRLAELQRKYREKQRELSKLTPKKSSSVDGSNGTTVDQAGTTTQSPTKRGPGRPRKKCNRLILDSSFVLSSSSVANGQSKPRLGRPPILKSKDSINSSKELPPPILEKVTDTRPRSRFDAEDCAAPKLKASKLDILKPPTLTANKIASYSKLKPATLSSNICTKGLKLPQCNVNLVKLTTNHNGNLKVKDSGMKMCSANALKKNCNSILEEARNKIGSVFSPDGSDKHSGEEAHSWFKPIDKSLCTTKQEHDTLSIESSESTSSRKMKPSLLPSSSSSSSSISSASSSSSTSSASSSSSSSSSSSKKRKVGRPKKHPSGSGGEDPTETIVAKKPKSKSCLVGFLLSKSKSSKVSSSQQTPVRTFGQSLDSSYCTSTTNNSEDGKSSPVNGCNLQSNYLKLDSANSDNTSDHKPKKIRPKLKAEAKIKTWTLGEDDDAEGIDWSSENIMQSKDLPKEEWFKKTEKIEKSTKMHDAPNRSRKRKISSSESKPSCNHKGSKKSHIIGTGNEKLAAAIPDNDNIDDNSNNPKKHKRSGSNSSTNHASSGGTSEGDDVPLSMYGSKLNGNANCSNNSSNSNKAALSCVLTQTHLNEDKQRALTVMGGLFYAGTLSAIRAPDVYGITIDGERGNRPHIFSREEILRDAILEVRPTCITTLVPGTRICAYWSQQYRCLYPGTVAQPTSPDPELDSHFVNVEFDDGDSGRINIDDIRLLPPNYPTLEYDPNPLLTLGKRRRRNSGASCESHSKDRRTNSDVSASGLLNNCNSSTKSSSCTKQMVEADGGHKKEGDGANSLSDICERSIILDKTEDVHHVSSTLLSEEIKKTESGDGSGKSDSGERTSRERKRLKKRRKEKLKKLLSCVGSLTSETLIKKRRKKHRCYEEHCKHKKHHKRHRKHKHRHGSRNKESSCGSSGESSSKSGHSGGDPLTRLSPVLERLDILDIQQNATGIKQISSSEKSSSKSTSNAVKSNSDPKGTSSIGNADDDDDDEPDSTVVAVSSGSSSTCVNNNNKNISSATPNTSTTNIMSSTTISASTTTATTSNITQSSTATPDATMKTRSASSVSSSLSNNPSSPAIHDDGSASSDDELEQDTASSGKKGKDNEVGKPKKNRDRQSSVESRSKIAAFLPARQLWGWSGRGFKRPGAKGRGRKEFYKAIQRGKETIMVGDCAVFLSTGRPDRPYIGRIESMWEAWGTNMVVRVKWFYHPEETTGCTVQLKYPGALFESPHVDENDVQTISHKCEVLPLDTYTGRLGTEPERYSSIYDNNDIYYLAGYYDPTTSQLSMKPGVV